MPKATSGVSPSRDTSEPRAVKDPEQARKHLAREPGYPWCAPAVVGPCREVERRTPMMHAPRKSDSSVVPTNWPNKPAQAGAEVKEGRGLAKGNLLEQNMLRTQGRSSMQSALERVRQAAKGDRSKRFTALLHHVYSRDTLREAYFNLKKDAAPGVDGQTWRWYEPDLEEHLQDLSDRLKRGAYRASPVRRVYITKDSGGQRPLGVTTLEDKIVQRATVEVLNAIYETDFLGFSYGFRPGRSQHHCLDALYAGLLTRPVNWVLDVDIRGFFDSLSHEWLVKFVQHRIADQRIVRLIQKWLNAGVLEQGTHTQAQVGTPQGGSASPLLANIYLHYVFDLWVQRWRRQHARGKVIVVRYADDIVLGFQVKSDAEQFWAELIQRMAQFGLQLHPEKTRLLEFGPYAAARRKRAGLGKPETFNFLGFTHICTTKRSNGRFTVLRQTMRRRLQAKLREVKTELRRRWHEPIPVQGQWLGAVVRGHIGYYGVPMNGPALHLFRFQVGRLWYRALCRRSHKGRPRWERMRRLIQQWLPLARVCHPYPLYRLGVIT